MALARIHLDLTDMTAPRMDVDGQDVDVSKASRLSVDMRPNEAAKVYVEVPTAGTLDLEGVVVERVVEKAPALNASEVLKAFLSKIDPATLERAMLAQYDGMGGVTSAGQAAINVLMEYADGHVSRA